MDRRAIIVGAGIGGLAVGRALHDDGWNVQILERAAALPSTGTALGIWPEAMAALDRLGVGDSVREQGMLQQGATFLRPDGTAFARIASGEPAYLIPRPALHETLYEGALEGCVRWASDVRAASALPEADLVIGADGINSRIRHAVTGRRLDPRPLGTVAFRGIGPGTADDVTETWGEGRLFGITPQDAQTINWFACVRNDLLDEYSALGDSELLFELFGDWHGPVVDIVRKVSAAKIDRRALYDSAPVSTMVRGRTAIIGDAAHAMAPNAGRGACEALIDAVQIADSLRSTVTLEDGLQVFDRVRRRRVQRTVRLSRLLNRLSTARRFSGLRQRTMSALLCFA